MDIGTIGIWSSELRRSERAVAAESAAELDGLGYGALWFPGGSGGAVLERAGELLEATSRAVVATGILNVWMHEPADVAAGHAALTAAHPGRFLLGIGIGHAPQLEPGRWRKPLATMRAYLDGLDAADPPVPREARIAAALGPKMLDLAAERSLGAFSYFVPPEHTRFARERIGPDAVLAVELAVVLEPDDETARAHARRYAATYLRLRNYTRNLQRFGFTERETEGGGSDRLIDTVIPHGPPEAIADAVRAHRDAGADHVCLQPLGDGAARAEGYRALAAAVL
jgi:probable F420-dependent oxidoreductase